MNFIKDLSVDKVLNLAEDTFNQVKPKSDVEARVYEVLSHKNWGSSSTILNQVAQDTYDYDKCEWLWESCIERHKIVADIVIWFVSGRDAVAISLRFVRSLYIIRHACIRLDSVCGCAHHLPRSLYRPTFLTTTCGLYPPLHACFVSNLTPESYLSLTANFCRPLYRHMMQSRSLPASCGSPWRPSVRPRGASSSRA